LRSRRHLAYSLEGHEFAFSFFGAIKIGARCSQFPVNTPAQASRISINSEELRELGVSGGSECSILTLKPSPGIASYWSTPSGWEAKITCGAFVASTMLVYLSELPPTSKPAYKQRRFRFSGSIRQASTGVLKAASICNTTWWFVPSATPKGILGMTEDDADFSVAKLFFAYGTGQTRSISAGGLGGHQQPVAGLAQARSTYSGHQAPIGPTRFFSVPSNMQVCGLRSCKVLQRETAAGFSEVRQL